MNTYPHLTIKEITTTVFRLPMQGALRWGKASAIVPTTVTNITNAQNSPCGTENTNYFVRCYDLGPASILDGTHTIDVLMRPNATAGGNGYIQVSLDGLQIFRYDGPFGFPEDATNFSSNFGQPGRYKFDWWNGNTQRSSTIGSPPTNTNSNLKKGMQIMIHKYEVRRRL